MCQPDEEDKWECYLCGDDFEIRQLPGGWLRNTHLLCVKCANRVFFDSESKYHQTMTYHYLFGDINLIKQKDLTDFGLPD